MKKENNNKGFTLVELVVAIAVLAIAITPILTSFITSAKLNVKSRKLMAATNVCQSIMEGFADKTYTEVLFICKKNGTGTGKYIFSTVSANAYNESDAWKKAPDDFGDLTSLAAMSNTKSKINWNGASASSNYIYVDGSASATVYASMLDSIQRYFGLEMWNWRTVAKNDTPNIGWWTDQKEQVLAIYYESISEGGFKFDAIVVFVPAATTDSDEYYPYYVNIYLYSAKDDMQVEDYLQPMMTYTSGIKNISQKGNVER